MNVAFVMMIIVLFGIPLGLALFVCFLMLTHGATEEEMFDDGSWGQDIDQIAKNRYKSDV